jgi:ABC-type sugar transport systems, permease components
MRGQKPILRNKRGLQTKREAGGPRRRTRLRGSLWGFAFLLPNLAGTAVFVLIPSLDTARRAFTDGTGRFVWLKNFLSVLNNEAFALAAANTARFMLTCVPLLLILSLLLAMMLSHKRMRSPTLRAGFLLPMAIPVASIALLWQVFFSRYGALNGFLQGIGVSGQDWLNTDAAFRVVVGSYIWRNIGYDMVLFLAALSAIPANLYEAAQMDGIGAWGQFKIITLPHLKPALYMVTILSLLNAFKAFREVYLAAGSYPHDSIYMLQHLFNNWFTKLEMEKLCAAAVMMAVVICALIALLQRLWKTKDNK